MPRKPAKPQRMVGRIFRGSEAIGAGLVTHRQLRSSAWQKVFHGVYADADLEVGQLHKAQAACAYLLPEGGIVTARSAALLYGVALMPEQDELEVLVPAPFGPVAGLRVLFGQAAEDEIHRRADRIRLASPVRTCWDLTRLLDLAEAVVYLDALLGKGLVTVPELVEYGWKRSGERGCWGFMRAVRLTDRAAESPQESRLRVGLVGRGIPRPVAQFVVTRDGRFVARVDLAWPDLKVAVEYDGRWHASHEQLERDRERLNRLLGADWIVLHVTANRLRDDLDGFARELAAILKIRRNSLKKT